MSEKTLAGRKALVTGGARGIGAAIAEALTNAGASVMIGDILADLGKETAGRLAKTGAKTGFVELNVIDDAQWEKAVAATIATLGGYDILINNAGIGTASPRQTSSEEFETEPWPVGNFRRRPGHRDPSG